MSLKTKYVIITVIYCVVMLSFWLVWVEPENRVRVTPSNPTHHFVDTTGCTIPYFDPFDETVLKFHNPPKHLRCSKNVAMTYQENLTLKLNRSAGNLSYCEYQEIIRNARQDFSISFSNSTKFSQNINMTIEFVRVYCYDWSGKHIYTNYHAFNQRKEHVLPDLDKKLLLHKKQNKPKEVFNVLMIGIDSLSRANHIRNMPKTRNFLLNTLLAIDFQGYTKVADNTFLNIVPMLTGNYAEEEYKRSRTINIRGPFDKFNIIWKNFSANGYSTMYGEDAPIMSTFNGGTYGFIHPPVDHYLRPFSYALEKDLTAWKKGRDCVWDRSETKVVLDFSYDFINTYHSRPHFDFTFISRLTHDRLERAASGDDDYLGFLQNLHKLGLLTNTVLFFFGDHGMRYGKFLKTDIGQMELRMPLMYLAFPIWFQNKYPQIMHNVLGNSRRLTSAFDIYETLKDILYFNGTPRKTNNSTQRGISFFDTIPETRTCDDATIDPQWCVCKLTELKIPQNDSVANHSVDFLIRNINQKVVNHTVCEKLMLKSVTHVKHFDYPQNNPTNVTRKASITTDRSDDRTGLSLYKIYLTLMPGNAEFEAAVQYNRFKRVFRLAGDISRVNKYGKTADCVERGTLRKFCYCKQQYTTSKTVSSTPITST